MTVQSVLGRTPPELIKEIFVLHDGNSAKGTKDKELEWELVQLEHLSEKINVVHFSNYLGRFKCRTRVIEHNATGEVLVLMDPYVEVFSSAWLQQLLAPLMEHPRTLSAPMIHQMTKNRTLAVKNGKASHYLMLNKKLEMERWQSRFVGEVSEHPSLWEPYATAFFESPVYAIRRDEFKALGGHDHGLDYIKGDNIELSLKLWMCRGRVMAVPCARVGHISESEWTLPPIPKRRIVRHGEFKYYGKPAEQRNYDASSQLYARYASVDG